MSSKWGHYLRTKNTMEKQFRWQNITERVGIEQMGGWEGDVEEDLQHSDSFQQEGKCNTELETRVGKTSEGILPKE